MCKICKEVLKSPTWDPDEEETELIMNKIALAIEKGKDPEHFAAVLDKLLGTGIPKKNDSLDYLWESKNRQKNGP